MYWLAKEEVAHTTKFNSLKDLVISLGCDYLRELSLGRNAQYSSEQIISELLQSLSLVIEERILNEMQSSNFFALMTDDSLVPRPSSLPSLPIIMRRFEI